MPRTYVRRIGARSYRNYTKETLTEAVTQILNKQLSLREASDRYNSHKNTLWLKTKRGPECSNAIPVPMKIPGGQRVFPDDEMGFAVHVISMSTYGFPITCFDLLSIAKSYLDRTGRKVPAFRNNFPGRDWDESFMKRHKDFISQRTAKNITYSRASTYETIVNDFFSNLEKEIAGVPPEQIWKYDKTYLVDDPRNTARMQVPRANSKFINIFDVLWEWCRETSAFIY